MKLLDFWGVTGWLELRRTEKTVQKKLGWIYGRRKTAALYVVRRKLSRCHETERERERKIIRGRRRQKKTTKKGFFEARSLLTAANFRIYKNPRKGKFWHSSSALFLSRICKKISSFSSASRHGISHMRFFVLFFPLSQKKVLNLFRFFWDSVVNSIHNIWWFSSIFRCPSRVGSRDWLDMLINRRKKRKRGRNWDAKSGSKRPSSSHPLPPTYSHIRPRMKRRKKRHRKEFIPQHFISLSLREMENFKDILGKWRFYMWNTELVFKK